MQTYLAHTLLYLRDPVQDTDIEGKPIERERGYIYPGETFRLPDDERYAERIAVWTELGYIEPAAKAKRARKDDEPAGSAESQE